MSTEGPFVPQVSDSTAPQVSWTSPKHLLATSKVTLAPNVGEKEYLVIGGCLCGWTFQTSAGESATQIVQDAYDAHVDQESAAPSTPEPIVYVLIFRPMETYELVGVFTTMDGAKRAATKHEEWSDSPWGWDEGLEDPDDGRGATLGQFEIHRVAIQL